MHSLPSFAHLDLIATPVFQVRPDWTRSTLKNNKHNIFFRIVLELVLSPRGNDCKIPLAELMALELLIEGLTD
jgi:hypothetical protein